MKTGQPKDGNESPNTAKPLDPRMNPGDPTKPRHAALDMIIGLIKDSGNITREASHMEEIEIPFSDLKLEKGIDYNMSGAGAHQQVSMLVDKYLKTNIYPGNRRYTVARIEQSANKIFV